MENAKKPIPDRLKSELKHFDSRYNPRAAPAPQFVDDSLERAMYNELIGPLAGPSGPISRQYGISPAALPSPRVTSAGDENRGSSNFDDCLIDRLTHAEKENKAFRRQLAESFEKIEKLEKYNYELETTLSAYQDENVQGKLIELQREKKHLSSQIEEMLTFLRDYGLEWVGFQDELSGGSGSELEQDDDSEGKISEPRGHPVKILDFIKKIEELNGVISSEPAEIVVSDTSNTVGQFGSRKARLVKPDEMREKINVTIYQNGLLVKRGPFRECGSSTYNSFVKDIMDGYFPSEFKHEHPDGLLINVIDKQNKPFSEKESDEKMNSDQFLRRLPKTVVRNGNLVSVRDDIASAIGAGEVESKVSKDKDAPTPAPAKNIVVVESSSYKESKENKGEGKDTSDAVRECTIQVRWLDGTRAMILKMSDTDMVGDVREEIKRLKGGLDCPQFQLRGSFPPRVLSDYLSLHEAGLIPNGIVSAVSPESQI